MNGARCDHWHGLMALRAVGQLEAEDGWALDAHLEGCAECRDEAVDLATAAAALPFADPLRILSDERPPAGLAESVLARLQRDAEDAGRRTNRRRRTTWIGSGAVVGAVAAALVAVAVFFSAGHHSPPSDRTVALHGPTGVHASVVLAPERWGTEVRLQETGQTPGEVMWVSMGTGGSDAKWVGGSYRTVAGGTVNASFPCALPADSIDHIWVHDDKGHTVLWSGYAV